MTITNTSGEAPKAFYFSNIGDVCSWDRPHVSSLPRHGFKIMKGDA